ncbi:hypothetical protein [Salinigranum salinum]|uniref:hypothetical protein n=1 Tax=Salinigranum salinum TaxID=1364937 RepID=UPI00126052CE|nr:hypothetical protein [Salinigranum salinum]
MNTALVGVGVLMILLGLSGVLRPMNPYLRNFSSARSWRENPAEAERRHRRRARRWGGVIVLLGIGVVVGVGD